MESILNKLQTLSESDFYPYHMPGHKRNGAPVFSTDITEIDEFDNLHHATGILKEAQERAAGLYGSKESFYLVNGSTCGLLAAIFATFQRGDTVLVARNCHKAVYHAIEIRGLNPVFIYPKTDRKYDISVGISAEQVSDVLKNYDSECGKIITDTKEAFEKCDGGKARIGKIKGMILTSPTYEGLISDIEGIADFLHNRDMVLIVDEAHGAHFGFHRAFPESAIKQGADLVIQSLHKTLPSMTQTALLHRCSDRVDIAKIRKYLGVFQTSSPSYVFMAHMDACVDLLQEQGTELFEEFACRLNDFYKICESFEHIMVYRPADPGKVLISADCYTGKELYDILRSRYHLQPEMCAGNYVLAIMTICDTEVGFERLHQALSELDAELADSGRICKTEEQSANKTLVSLVKMRPEQKYYPYEIEAKEKKMVKLAEAEGCVSAEYIYLYPPGIPFIVPGEVITGEMAELFWDLQSEGYELQGPTDVTGEFLKVLL